MKKGSRPTLSRIVRDASKKAGLPPGTLVHIGEKKTGRVAITRIAYDETRFECREAETMGECFPLEEPPAVTWIHVRGVHEITLIEEIGRLLNLHPLLLEDIAHTGQRPKMEEYGDYLFVTSRMLTCQEAREHVQAEQISMIIGPHFVVSFQEHDADAFASLKERLQNSKGKVRKMGADYLAYAMMDTIVDGYFVVLEGLGERIEELEAELISAPSPATLQSLHTLKREMILLRKSIWPLREVIAAMERGESALIGDATQVYLRDLYDHTVRVMDTVETFRDLLSGMLEMYLSSISNRMNEVIKVLTLITTVFIPMSFIAGVYGMNFKYMPELEWRLGYPFALSFMCAVGIAMLVYFAKKRWL